MQTEDKRLVEVEAAGIIINARVQIEASLKKNRAFDEKSATDLMEFEAVLAVMEKSGLIARTPDGKVFMTKKGQEKQIRGFSIKGPAHKIRKFSRNK
jgi:hypothetical protein